MNEKVKDISYVITKGAIGSVPVAGGVLSELFTLVFSDPTTKRKEQVISDIENRLELLEKEGVDLEHLKNSDEFLSITIQAYNIAMRTHQTEKRDALMNAIYNTPLLSIDENEKLMFLNYIDQFNEWHLRILWFLDNPALVFERKTKKDHDMSGKATVLGNAYPELNNKRYFVEQIVSDLCARGLVVFSNSQDTMAGDYLYLYSTTNVGKSFIRFITIK